MQKLKCRQEWLSLDTPQIMGVINLTTDSFYAGSREMAGKKVIEKAKRMLANGASIIDLGAMSSRPGAAISNSHDELKYLLPVVENLASLQDCIISIDTIHASVARECLEAGAHMINDISGGIYDTEMLDVVAKYDAAFVAMHMKGTPETMQSEASYPDGVGASVLAHFVNWLKTLAKKGIHDVVIDPGFGFAKSIKHNYQLLNELKAFQILEHPIMVGVSRKSMIWKHLGLTPETALNGTTAVHMLALNNGANILRVHDVPEALECIQIWNAYCDVKSGE